MLLQIDIAYLYIDSNDSINGYSCLSYNSMVGLRMYNLIFRFLAA